MNLLKRLTIKNLKLNKKRTLVTIMGIVLSVALLTAVTSIYSSFIDSMIIFEKQAKGDFHTYFENIPVSELSTFENNRSMETIHLTKNVGYAYLKESKNEYKPYAFIQAFTKDSFENLGIRLIEGRLPENNDEIVIPSHLKSNGRVNFKVGDTLTLEVGKRVDEEGNTLTQHDPYTPYDYSEMTTDALTNEVIEEGEGVARKEKIIDTKTKTYQIVGIMERPSNAIENYSAPGYTFITCMDQVEEGNINIFVRFTKEGLNKKEETKAAIMGIDYVTWEKYINGEENLSTEEIQELKDKTSQQYIEDNRYLVILETNPLQEGTIVGLGTVVAIVCGIIIFTSVFCIKNSFDISLSEKIKQYGMLRSIGATKKQMRRNVFFEATILGVIGIPLGIFFGLLASFILILVSNYFLSEAINITLYFSFSLVALVLAIILSIITIYLSSLRSAMKASKITPIDSIRNSADLKIKSKKLKCPKIIQKSLGVGGEISYKNLKRNKKKYRTTIFSIVISVAIFIGLSSFVDLSFIAVQNTVGPSDYNITVGLSLSSEEDYQKLLKITELDTVVDYKIERFTNADLSNPKSNEKYNQILKYLKEEQNIEFGYDMVVRTMGPNYRKYVESLGLAYNEVKDKGILIDSNDGFYSFQYGRQDGTVEEITYQGKIYEYRAHDKVNIIINNHSISLELAAIVDKGPEIFENQHAYILVSDEYYGQNIEPYRDMMYDSHVSMNINSTNPSKLQDDIDLLMTDTAYVVYNQEEETRLLNNLFTLIGIFLYGFIIVISLIGITNIFNTITTSMELRKQEFAMLKSIGMTKREFERMIRLESVFIGTKSLLFGIPLGLLFSLFIANAFEANKFYQLPLLAILCSIVIVFLLITCIMKYTMNKINKQNTIETIRNENI